MVRGGSGGGGGQLAGTHLAATGVHQLVQVDIIHSTFEQIDMLARCSQVLDLLPGEHLARLRSAGRLPPLSHAVECNPCSAT